MDDHGDVAHLRELEVLLELLRRFPTKLDEDAIETWSRSAQSVGAAISRMELWADIMNGPYADRLEQLLPELLPRAQVIPAPWSRYLLPALFGTTQLGWPPGHFSDSFWHGDFVALNSTRWNGGDPIDHLALWPLPTDLKSLAISSQEYPSAFSLMCAINANPAQVVGRN